MSYISPIKIEEIPQMEEGWADKIGKYIAGEVDNLVLESCVKVGCRVDKDELEKALRYDRDQYFKGYADGKRDAASPWHRVEDGMPEVGEYVLAGEWGKFAIVDKWCGDKWGFADEGATYTHWQRIEPPQEDA
jgi:hypothetical protein